MQGYFLCAIDNYNTINHIIEKILEQHLQKFRHILNDYIKTLTLEKVVCGAKRKQLLP